ncbi:TOPRIM nucleotidyl transferase/hydrolase domain-containing protein [Peribacillus sp. SCS-37]|uniref:TOPRIM nucleotidyl transferase/hydrolase domain-containing protein n=1 Tax=Paraperibacillus esterisolvens TaxID=3115296 RepID=UPI0039063747
MINDLTNPLKFLVGINGSGKTYALNQALKEQEHQSFLITEDGMPIIPRHMNKIAINFESMTYTYLDEGSRGELDRVTEEESISDRVHKVINYCREIMGKLDLFKKKSKGQEKLYNMMSIFNNYNLNTIRIIYFDEPENFLDEEFLKVVGEFFGVLNDSDFIIRIATHNSRLLSILKIKLEDIIFFNSHAQFNITENEIIELYSTASSDIETIRLEQNIQPDASIKYKLDLLNHSHAYDNFIQQNLKNEDLYRSLFYKKIIIVEGQSDITALSSMKNDFESSIEIYNPNGKAFIPFFVNLFLLLKKEVIVIIDDDSPTTVEDGNIKHPVAITHYLRNLEARGLIRLVVHTPDLEGFYNIDLDQIARTLGMSSSVKNKNKGWHKSLAAFIFFSDEDNKQRLKRHILDMGDESQFEFR